MEPSSSSSTIFKRDTEFSLLLIGLVIFAFSRHRSPPDQTIPITLYITIRSLSTAVVVRHLSGRAVKVARPSFSVQEIILCRILLPCLYSRFIITSRNALLDACQIIVGRQARLEEKGAGFINFSHIIFLGEGILPNLAHLWAKTPIIYTILHIRRQNQTQFNAFQGIQINFNKKILNLRPHLNVKLLLYYLGWPSSEVALQNSLAIYFVKVIVFYNYTFV